MDGRQAAYKAVLAALRGGGFVQETLGHARSGGKLPAREAALAMEIGLGTIRRLITIEHVLSKVARYDSRRVKPELRAAIVTGAFQIVCMQRTPVFAAVDQAVRLVRRGPRDRAGGMVNAVLRNLTRAIASRDAEWTGLNQRLVRTGWDRACAFNSNVLPPVGDEEQRAAHMAAAAGERPERFKALASRHGFQLAEEIAWASQASPATVLHRNMLRIDSGVFEERVRAEFGGEAEWTPDGAFMPPQVKAVESALFKEGRAYVQDMTARAGALLLDARRGESILDLCAAPGGKAVALAQQIGDYGEVLACDVSRDRVVRIAENAERMRLRSIRTRLIDAEKGADELEREFDAAIVDVPCSNSGVFARRPEARLGFTRRKLESLLALQGRLLRQAARRVRVGGRLVYSTCSIEPEENEDMAAAFVAENSAWKLLLSRLTTPRWGARWSDWRDGGYAALLVRES